MEEWIFWRNRDTRARENSDLEQDRLVDLSRPSMKLRPRLSIDGNQWCALLGENLQHGVAGFGNSPAEAYTDFDASWVQQLPQDERRRG